MDKINDETETTATEVWICYYQFFSICSTDKYTNIHSFKKSETERVIQNSDKKVSLMDDKKNDLLLSNR